MRSEKQYLLDEILDKIKASKSLVIAKYTSIEPNVSWQFRSNLAKSGGSLAIVKKRVFQKAAEKCGISLDIDQLQGNIGLVFSSNESLETTKAVFKFSKDNEEKFEVLFGQFEGQMYSAKDVKALAELPSLDEMRSLLLGLFEAPMSQTLSVIESLLTSVMHCLENKSQNEPS